MDRIIIRDNNGISYIPPTIVYKEYEWWGIEQFIKETNRVPECIKNEKYIIIVNLTGKPKVIENKYYVNI